MKSASPYNFERDFLNARCGVHLAQLRSAGRLGVFRVRIDKLDCQITTVKSLHGPICRKLLPLRTLRYYFFASGRIAFESSNGYLSPAFSTAQNARKMGSVLISGHYRKMLVIDTIDLNWLCSSDLSIGTHGLLSRR